MKSTMLSFEQFVDEYKRLNPKVLELPYGELSRYVQEQFHKYMDLISNNRDHNAAIDQLKFNPDGKPSILC